MSEIDMHKSTPAVIEWRSSDATRSLIDPDPKFGNITLTTCFDTKCSFFELSIPVKIKHTRLKDDNDGDNSISALFLRINAAAVKTLTFASTTTARNSIHNKLSSRASRLMCLNFETERNPDILVPENAEEPLVPGRSQSGTILDAIRQISNTTYLSVYIQDSVLSVTQLQAISSACSQGLYKTRDSDRHDLKSLYGGKGAKVVRLQPQTGQQPPSYNEVTSPPPSAPIAPSNQLKRPRQDSEPERGDARNEPRAVLGRKQEEMLAEMEERILVRIEERLIGLENENERLKGVEDENRHLRETIDKLLACIENRNDDIHRIDEQTSKNAADIVTNDDELADLRHDLDELKERVDFIENGDLLETVKNDVVDYIKTRL